MSYVVENIFGDDEVEASQTESVMLKMTKEEPSTHRPLLPLFNHPEPSHELFLISGWDHSNNLPIGPVPNSQIYVTTACHVTGDVVRAFTGPNHDSMMLMVYSEGREGIWEWVLSNCEACEDKIRTILDERRCGIPFAVDLEVERRNQGTTDKKTATDKNLEITDKLSDIIISDKDRKTPDDIIPAASPTISWPESDKTDKSHGSATPDIDWPEEELETDKAVISTENDYSDSFSRFFRKFWKN